MRNLRAVDVCRRESSKPTGIDGLRVYSALSGCRGRLAASSLVGLICIWGVGCQTSRQAATSYPAAARSLSTAGGPTAYARNQPGSCDCRQTVASRKVLCGKNCRCGRPGESACAAIAAADLAAADERSISPTQRLTCRETGFLEMEAKSTGTRRVAHVGESADVDRSANSVQQSARMLVSPGDCSDAGDAPTLGATPFTNRCPAELDAPSIVSRHRVLSFEDDLEDFLPRLGDDTRGLANWNNAVYLGAALAGAIAIRQDLDDEIREDTARHPKRWGAASESLGKLGEAPYQIPVLLGLYAYGVHRQDAELHDLTTTIISAYTLTGLTTVAVKGIANTDRPSDEWNGGQFGFPSFHTASSFAIAAVLDDYYGCRAGLPAYTLAGLIGWSRIDERDHDLSDVVFGAALGYVIGKSVAGRHLYGDSRARLVPYVHPSDGSSGLAMDVAF